MKIGELAQQAECPVETIRYYEKEGLLPPPFRAPNNYRAYTESHLERLQFIRNCRSLDMSHDEIRLLLEWRDDPATHCAEVNDLIDEHIQHVSARIRALMGLEQQLIALRNRCTSEAESEQCKILDQLNAAATLSQREAGAGSHVSATTHSARGRKGRASGLNSR